MKTFLVLSLITIFFIVSCNNSAKEHVNRIPVEDINIYVDPYEVTVADFRTFLANNQHHTTADSIGDGVYFDYSINNWRIVKNANWEYPDGENKAQDNYPVTQVSYKDACAYCKWKNGRLPTENEWSNIAGNKLTVGNFWQGIFPWEDSGEDDYLAKAAPVGSYKNDVNGIYDLFGNVWEWTGSSPPNMLKNTFNNLPLTFETKKQKLTKGGSFLCEPNSCGGYLPGRFQATDINTTTNNLGFRCVYDK